jgi:hypothetical protein
MVFNATYTNISAIAWRSVLLLEETEDLEKITASTEIELYIFYTNAV